MLALALLLLTFACFSVTNSFKVYKVTSIPKRTLIPLFSGNTYDRPISLDRKWTMQGLSITNYTSLTKRVITGLSMGLLSTLWIFGGKHIFSAGFSIASVIAQSEYAKITSLPDNAAFMITQHLFSILCYVTASYFPLLHDAVLPLFISVLVVLLLLRDKPVTLTDVSSPLLGVFLIGYLPSFWLRLSLGSGNAFLAKVPFFQNNFIDKYVLYNRKWMQSLLIWWTWAGIVVADVGAYFFGKSYGKNKLSVISTAAGLASPNKTVDGALAGFIGCTLFSLLGAFIMKWPLWQISGFLYGLLMSFFALVGDLTMSLLKRHAGVKDSGKILPGHGGLLDRIDSYILNAPMAYLFITFLLPCLASRL